LFDARGPQIHDIDNTPPHGMTPLCHVLARQLDSHDETNFEGFQQSSVYALSFRQHIRPALKILLLGVKRPGGEKNRYKCQVEYSLYKKLNKMWLGAKKCHQ